MVLRVVRLQMSLPQEKDVVKEDCSTLNTGGIHGLSYTSVFTQAERHANSWLRPTLPTFEHRYKLPATQGAS